MALDARVHPIVTVDQPRILVVLGVFERVFRVVQRYWNSIQVGHRGRYSVERLLAFQEYYQRTSPTRAFIVCFLALVPPFIVAILIDLIPLKPPDLGWKANYAFWLRLYATALPIATGGFYQVKEVIEPGAVSNRGEIVVIVGTATCYVALVMATAALWKFPIPFGFVLSIAPFIGIYMVLLTLNIGPRVLARSPTLRRQLTLQLFVVAAEGILGIAYPTFAAIFHQLSRTGQTAFIFVLPIIKFSIKQFVAKMSAHLHEYVGLTVLLSVDVCNVLYVAICVQTAASPITSALLIGSDAFFVLIALRSIYYQSDVGQARQRLLSMNSKLPATLYYIRNLRALLRDAFQSPAAVRAPRVPIRIRAPFPLHLSAESVAFMDQLELVGRRYSLELPKEATADSTMSKTWSRGRSAKIHYHEKRESSRTMSPTPPHSSKDYLQIPSTPQRINSSFPRPVLAHKVSRKTSVVNSIRRSTRSSVPRTTSRAETYHYQTVVADVQDSLQALFHTEYVVVAEFIECVIPMLYGVYLAVLYRLPTAQYYPNVRTLTPEKFASTELNIMLYAAVEFSSFLGVNLLLQRKFGFSPLYQLAFVCETHARAIQSHTIIWILYVLTLTLDHNGVDLEAPFK